MGKQKKLETKEEYNKRMNAYMKARYAEVAEWLKEYKVSVGCKDCGYNAHHAGLEFDHIVPRNGDTNLTISRMAGRGKARIMREIEEKCEVVCGTCHNIRTWSRKQASLVEHAG